MQVQVHVCLHAYNYLHERVQVIMHVHVHVHVLTLYLVGAPCSISGVGPGDHLKLLLVRLVPGENIAHHPSYRRHLPAGELSHVVFISSSWLTCKRRYSSPWSSLVGSAILPGEQKLGLGWWPAVMWWLAGSLQTTHNWYHSCRQSQALYHRFAVEVFSGITVRRTKLTSLRGAIFWQEFH